MGRGWVYTSSSPLWNSRQTADQFPVVIGGSAVVDLESTGLAHVQNTNAFLLVVFHPNRRHQPLAIIRPVAWHIEVNVEGVEAMGTMIPATASWMRFHDASTILAFEPFVVLNHVLSDVHVDLVTSF